jgi:hypothetical protein
VAAETLGRVGEDVDRGARSHPLIRVRGVATDLGYCAALQRPSRWWGRGRSGWSCLVLSDAREQVCTASPRRVGAGASSAVVAHRAKALAGKRAAAVAVAGMLPGERVTLAAALADGRHHRKHRPQSWQTKPRQR